MDGYILKGWNEAVASISEAAFKADRAPEESLSKSVRSNGETNPLVMAIDKKMMFISTTRQQRMISLKDLWHSLFLRKIDDKEALSLHRGTHDSLSPVTGVAFCCSYRFCGGCLKGHIQAAKERPGILRCPARIALESQGVTAVQRSDPTDEPDFWDLVHKQKWQECPGCGTIVEKESGCATIQCKAKHSASANRPPFDDIEESQTVKDARKHFAKSDSVPALPVFRASESGKEYIRKSQTTLSLVFRNANFEQSNLATVRCAELRCAGANFFDH
ncbi:hypothetical protein BJ742DRAFT_736406 [Cladochytrium replicatum]|nr:hypothetical protein BJ742DRAFT_736406 [Cladochytrium replicatum]